MRKIIILLLLVSACKSQNIEGSGLIYPEDGKWEYKCYTDEFTDVKTCSMIKGFYNQISRRVCAETSRGDTASCSHMMGEVNVRISSDNTLLIGFGLNNNPTISGSVRIDKNKVIRYEGTYLSGNRAKALLSQMLKGKGGVAQSYQWPYDSETVEFSLKDFSQSYKILLNRMTEYKRGSPN